MNILSAAPVTSTYKPAQHFQAEYNVLHVDDSTETRNAFRTEFESEAKLCEGDTWTLTQASTGAEGVKTLDAGGVDLLVTDGQLAFSDPLHGVDMVNAAIGHKVPYVAYSSDSPFCNKHFKKPGQLDELMTWIFTKGWKTDSQASQA